MIIRKIDDTLDKHRRKLITFRWPTHKTHFWRTKVRFRLYIRIQQRLQRNLPQHQIFNHTIKCLYANSLTKPTLPNEELKGGQLLSLGLLTKVLNKCLRTILILIEMQRPTYGLAIILNCLLLELGWLSTCIKIFLNYLIFWVCSILLGLFVDWPDAFSFLWIFLGLTTHWNFIEIGKLFTRVTAKTVSSFIA